MEGKDKTKEQVIKELLELRHRVAELEAIESRLVGAGKAIPLDGEPARLFYEHLPLGYQSLDEDGCLLEVNQGWLNALGCSREAVIGKWFGDFLAPGHQEQFGVNFHKMEAAGEFRNIEPEMVKKDGSHG